MKKLLLLLFAVCAFHFTQAQSVRLGLKAGPGLSSVRQDPLSKELTYKLRLHGGLMFNIPFSEVLHLQPEVLYSQKGFEYKSGGSASVYKSSYIDVPLMAMINIEGLYVEAGPQVSFLLKSQMNDVEVKAATKSTVFGYAVGLGYRAHHFIYGLRYNTDISKSYASMLGRASEGKNVVFQLSIGHIINQ